MEESEMNSSLRQGSSLHIEYVPAKRTILISSSNWHLLWRRIKWDFTDRVSQIVC